MACLAAGLSLGFRVAHAQPWVIAEGWAPVIAGLAMLALGEEAKLTDALGQDYRDYAARTRRLIPGLW